MNKVLLASAAVISLWSGAIAADLPRRAAPPVFAQMPVVPVFTWTGFYVGLQGGYAWGTDETQIVSGGLPAFPGGASKYDLEGAVGGGHAGFNVQLGPIVAGIEGDIEASGIKGNVAATDPLFPGFIATSRTEMNWQGSIRGRLGAAFDRVLIYATGGLAVADFDYTYTVTVPQGHFSRFGPGTYPETASATPWGWTVGGGVEYAFTNNLTSRVEYRYTRFEGISNASSFILPGGAAEQNPELHSVRGGISYKF